MPEGTSEMDALLILIFAPSISINLGWARWAAATSTRHEASWSPLRPIVDKHYETFQ